MYAPTSEAQMSAAFKALLLPACLLVAVPAQDVAAATDQAQEVAALAREDLFDVWEYRVSGNTLLAQTDIETLLYPHLGEDKGMSEVEEARQALETRYRDAGYPTVLVNIPEQDVSNGVVRLQVTEGRIDRLRITGARYYANGRIRAQLPEPSRPVPCRISPPCRRSWGSSINAPRIAASRR